MPVSTASASGCPRCSGTRSLSGWDRRGRRRPAAPARAHGPRATRRRERSHPRARREQGTGRPSRRAPPQRSSSPCRRPRRCPTTTSCPLSRRRTCRCAGSPGRSIPARRWPARASPRRPGGRCRPGSRPRWDRPGARRREPCAAPVTAVTASDRAVSMPSRPTSWWLLGPTRARPSTAPSRTRGRHRSWCCRRRTRARRARSREARARTDVTLRCVGTKVAVVGGGAPTPPNSSTGCATWKTGWSSTTWSCSTRATCGATSSVVCPSASCGRAGGAGPSRRRPTPTPRWRAPTSSSCNCASAVRRPATSTRPFPSATGAWARRRSVPVGSPRHCARCRSSWVWRRRWRHGPTPACGWWTSPTRSGS